MTLGSEDLVLCTGTLPRDASLVDRLDAAQRAGFAGVSMWMRDVERAEADGLAHRDVQRVVKDRGMGIAELDPLWSWIPDAGRDAPPTADPLSVRRHGTETMLTVAAGIGARSVNAVDLFGDVTDTAAVVEPFARLCDQAAELGLLVNLESLPWSGIPDFAAAVGIVRAADRPNGGVMLDSWHFFRGGSEIAELTAVDGALVNGVQLNDAPRRPEPDLRRATARSRRLPGHGELPLVELLRALHQIGSPAPIGVEVFSDRLAGLSADAVAARAGAAMRAVLAVARRDPGAQPT